jgi:hypothetical protein
MISAILCYGLGGRSIYRLVGSGGCNASGCIISGIFSNERENGSADGAIAPYNDDCDKTFSLILLLLSRLWYWPRDEPKGSADDVEDASEDDTLTDTPGLSRFLAEITL